LDCKSQTNLFQGVGLFGTELVTKEIVQFANRTEIIIRAITNNPHIFPASLKYNKIRKGIIDRNNSFFYTVDNIKNEIYLLTFFDNRQNLGSFRF
jgi:hypothetical protein